MLTEWMIRPTLTGVLTDPSALDKGKYQVVHATTTKCLRPLPESHSEQTREWLEARLAEQVEIEAQKGKRTMGMCEACVLIRKTAKAVQPKPTWGAVTPAYLAQLRAGLTHVDHDLLAKRVEDGTVTEKGRDAILAAEAAGKEAPAQPGPIVASQELRDESRKQAKPDATTKATIAKRAAARKKVAA